MDSQFEQKACCSLRKGMEAARLPGRLRLKRVQCAAQLPKTQTPSPSSLHPDGTVQAWGVQQASEWPAGAHSVTGQRCGSQTREGGWHPKAFVS